MSGFKSFILRGNLVDLAVAVVIGAQFSSLVKQFVQSFISPLLALIGGKPNFNSMVFTFHGSRFTYGAFLTEVLSFAISAAVVYFVVVVPVSRVQCWPGPVLSRARAVAARTVRKGSPAAQPIFRSGF